MNIQRKNSAHHFRMQSDWRYQFGKKIIDVRIFLFPVRRLETLVPKNHFVREVAPFPRSGHIYTFIYLFYTSYSYNSISRYT